MEIGVEHVHDRKAGVRRSTKNCAPVETMGPRSRRSCAAKCATGAAGGTTVVPYFLPCETRSCRCPIHL
jgi:hypothetical protein